MRQIFWNRQGTSSVEFAMVATLFFLIFFGIIDFGRFLWATNSAAKATQAGARFAIVSDPVWEDLTTFDCLSAAGGNGLTCPVSALTPNPVVCTVTGCSGSGPKDDAAFNAIVVAMQRIDPSIQPANVEVRYEHIGLGFAGNPFGSDIIPAVTVRLTGMVFSPITPGFSAIVSVNMAEYRTTLTGEDLSG